MTAKHNLPSLPRPVGYWCEGYFDSAEEAQSFCDNHAQIAEDVTALYCAGTLENYAIAAIEQDRAARVPDFCIKLYAQIQHMLDDCVSEETHDGLTFYTVDRSLTASNLIGALMRLFTAAPQPQLEEPTEAQ